MNNKLVADLRNGDRKVFEEIFGTYSQKITRFIYAILKSESDAQDLTQSIFAKLWENRESFNPVSIDGYMYTMARNAALNHIKSKKLRAAIIQDTTDSSPDSSTEDSIHTENILQLVDARVENMPENIRTIYKLSQKDGLTPADIAARLGLSEKTVRNQLSLIFGELREMVDNYLKN